MEDKDEKNESTTKPAEKTDNSKEEPKKSGEEEEKGANQFELFENKLRSILFPEPIFSQYINELKTKPSKAVNFPNVESVLSENDSKQGTKTCPTARPQYTRYLRTWKKNIVQSDKLTSYLSNLRELHLAKLITFIEQMHKNSQYTDLDLYVEDLCFPVHRIILACYAPFIFQKLERTKRKQHPIEKLRLVNIDPQSFATIIGFMYTGMAQPNETNFLPVLNTAIHLFMFEFANAWVELYEHKFTNRTAQMLFRSNIARQYGWPDYVQMLNLALAFDFEHLLVSDQFEDIRFEQLRDIIQMDNIGACSEIVLYLAVLKWLSFNFEERKQHTLDLMKQIRFANMDENELYACYNPPILPEVIDYPEVKAMMADAFNALVQQSRTNDDSLNGQTISKAKRRNFRLANVYKDEPLQLWCYLNEKKRTNLRCLPGSKQLKEFKDFKQFKERQTSKKDQPTGDKTVSSDSDPISSKFDSSSKYSSDFASSPTSSLASSPLGQAISTQTSIEKKEKMKQPESGSNTAEKLMSTDSVQEHDAKLAVLKQKPRLDDTTCRCKEIKHSSIEQCKRDRAAQIIQRSYKRYLEMKTKRNLQFDKKKNRTGPKIKTKFLGKNISARTMFKELDDSDSDLNRVDSSIGELMEELKDDKKKPLEAKHFTDGSKKSDKKWKIDKKRRKDDFGKRPIDSSSFGSTCSISGSQESVSKDEEKSVDKPLERASTATEPLPSSDLVKRESTKRSTRKQPHPDTISLAGSKPSTSKDEKMPIDSPKTRVEQLVLYSDSINPEFCGFYLCTGVNSSDGQLMSWKKNIPFNNQQSSKLLPPFDTVLVSHGQNIYLVGGVQIKPSQTLLVSKQIFKYQMGNRKFQSTSDLIVPRIQHSCVVAGDRLYVICGCKKLNTPVNSVECVHLMSSRKLQFNSEMLKLPSYGRFGQSAVYFRSRLWIIGGIAKIDNNFHLLSEIWILDVVRDNKWIKAKFPVPIAFAGICSVNEQFIYLVGGRCVGLNGKLQPSDKVWCFNVLTKRWQQIASLREPRCNCCCVLLDNRIYAFGGSLENDAEHLRGQTGEFYDLNNPNQGWKMLKKNLPTSIAGQSVACVSNF